MVEQLSGSCGVEVAMPLAFRLNNQEPALRRNDLGNGDVNSIFCFGLKLKIDRVGATQTIVQFLSDNLAGSLLTDFFFCSRSV